ncbi:hypothetical protein NDU88_000380 [Pleurodeles waltl]|uniref:Uncharacterized protein n=1 Tax=Pleurodeles waltl TaxID=8319 RepID=A0AAV7L6D8_PLEWA|nr:hypothetical protein NDU88_000380 [Pleurodeles waltl]
MDYEDAHGRFSAKPFELTAVDWLAPRLAPPPRRDVGTKPRPWAVLSPAPSETCLLKRAQSRAAVCGGGDRRARFGVKQQSGNHGPGSNSDIKHVWWGTPVIHALQLGSTD